MRRLDRSKLADQPVQQTETTIAIKVRWRTQKNLGVLSLLLSKKFLNLFHAKKDRRKLSDLDFFRCC